MQAIATLLNRNADEKTTKMWQDLEKTCGLSGIKIPQDPHFSWFVAEKFDEPGLKNEFLDISLQLTEFEISANGIGLFTGEKPILYIPIVKTRKLLELHEEIWRLLSPLGVKLSAFYQPEHWIPHITITSDDASLANINCIIETILHLPLTMTIPVNNLALIYAEEKSAGIKFVQEFRKGIS